MDKRGLASMYAEEQGIGITPMQQKVAPSSMPLPTVEEIVALLKQGITPQELAQQGVPPEMINQAMALLQQEVQSGQPQGQPMQGGLADMYAAEGSLQLIRSN